MENTFARVLPCQDKNELIKISKTLKIESRDFADLITVCKSGEFYLNQIMHFFDYEPEYLEGSERFKSIKFGSQSPDIK